jgi:predicted nuclease with TOPRIM domain
MEDYKMFEKLKKKIQEKKQEDSELRAYEKELRQKSIEKQKQLQKEAKKKALEEKYSKLEKKYSKTPAQRRAEAFKKIKTPNIWDKLGKWSDNSASMLETGSVKKKTQPKKKTNSVMDDFLNGRL